jgi:hypothetical protein
MPEIKPADAEILARAEKLGLRKAVTEVPQDVLAAAEAAARARGAYSPPDNPAAEPWPPMQVEKFR